MDDFEIAISLPLDSDGFLRRACPHCSREFKWLSTDDDDSVPSRSEYFCPYCGATAAADEWFTLEQSRYIEEEIFQEALRPSLEDLAGSLRQIGRSSGGLIEFTGSVEMPERQQAAPVFEPDDMRQVTPACHPSEPVKVDEARNGPVHCLCCGRLLDDAPK